MSAPTATPTGTWTSAAVTGDGTTARSRSGRRWRSARWFLVGAGSLVLVVAALALLRPPGTLIDFDPENTRSNGARAVAQVLGDQGVQIEHVTRVADAVSAAEPGTTLLVTPSPYLLPEQVDALAGVPADLVLVDAENDLVGAATGDRVQHGSLPWEPTTPVEPGCDLPAAVAAGPSLLEPGMEATGPEVTTCWHDGEGAAALAAVAQDGRSVTAVDDGTFLLNDGVLTEGNATLALQLLGAHERLVWLVPDPADTSATGGTDPDPTPAGILPSWFGAVLWWALLVALVVVVWQGRRLGRLVSEALPVVVPAAESTRGRARLYRRTRSRGHAAASLRAATAQHVARRLGVPRSAGADTVVDAVVRATGRDPHDVADLIYGPPPADDAALSELARRLDTLESEVHRP